MAFRPGVKQRQEGIAFEFMHILGKSRNLKFSVLYVMVLGISTCAVLLTCCWSQRHPKFLVNVYLWIL